MKKYRPTATFSRERRIEARREIQAARRACYRAYLLLNNHGNPTDGASARYYAMHLKELAELLLVEDGDDGLCDCAERGRT